MTLVVTNTVKDNTKYKIVNITKLNYCNLKSVAKKNIDKTHSSGHIITIYSF